MGKSLYKTVHYTKVTLCILRAGFPIVDDPQELKTNPKSVVEAQFSMPFGAAVAVLYRGRAGFVLKKKEGGYRNVDDRQRKEKIMRLLEYEAKEILRRYKIPLPSGIVTLL